MTPEAFALALLIAASLQIMENLLPRIPLFPWMRVGFSYVIILPVLLQFGPRAAFALFLARNVIAILYGQPLTTFLISGASGALTFACLGHPLAWAYRKNRLGVLGASVLMATGFNIFQLVLVNLALIRHAGFYFQTGPILAWSLLSGTAVALLIRFSDAELTDLFGSRPAPVPAQRPAAPAGRDLALFGLGLAAMAALLFSSRFALQLPALAILAMVVKDRFAMLLHSWPFFFYLAWLHLFHTPGAYWLEPWITREGAVQFSLYAARMANLILLGRWLSGRFPWQWAGGSRSPYLQGFLLSLPLLSGLFKPSLQLGRDIARRLAAGQRSGLLEPAFTAWRRRMEEASEASRTRGPGGGS